MAVLHLLLPSRGKVGSNDVRHGRRINALSHLSGVEEFDGLCGVILHCHACGKHHDADVVELDGF
jgi:hypothetical protein